MGQLVVRNIEEDVKTRLKRRARRRGQSMEEAVRDILRDAVKSDTPAGGLGTEIASLFVKIGLDEDIPELKGFKIKAPRFRR